MKLILIFLHIYRAAALTIGGRHQVIPCSHIGTSELGYVTGHRLGLESVVSDWLLSSISVTISTLLHSRTHRSIFIESSIVNFIVFHIHIIILGYGLLEHLLIGEEIVHHSTISLF